MIQSVTIDGCIEYHINAVVLYRNRSNLQEKGIMEASNSPAPHFFDGKVHKLYMYFLFSKNACILHALRSASLTHYSNV